MEGFNLSNLRWAPVECSVCRRDGNEAPDEHFFACRRCVLRI